MKPKLLTPAQARAFCRREEKRMQVEAEMRIDPHFAEKLRQIVKITGKSKVLAFVRSLP